MAHAPQDIPPSVPRRATVGREFVRVLADGSVGIIEVALPESLDGVEFDTAHETILRAVEAGPTPDHPSPAQAGWVLDFANSTYTGSSILGLMVNVRQRVKSAGGRLTLCGLSPRLLQVIHTCSMERLFTIHRNRAEAVRGVS